VPSGGRRGLATVQLARAEALFALGRPDPARECVHELLASLRTGDPLRLRATRLAARIEHLMGRNAESAAMLLRELNRSDRRTDSSLASLYLELATTRLMGGCFVEAREAALSAREFVTGDDHLLQSYAGAVVALSTSVSEDPAPAVEEWRQASMALDGLADAELARSLEAGVWLGWAEMFLERLPDARRHLERCLAIARRGAHQHLLPHLLIGHGSVLKSMGELVLAAESYDEAAEVAAQIASRELATMTLAMQCRVATWLGDLDRAEALGVRAVEAAAGRDNWFAAVAVAVLAQARVAAGRSDGCIEAILDAGGGPDLPNFDPSSRCDWWEVLTRAALLDSDPARAGGFARRATACAASLPLCSPRGYAAIAVAEVLLATDAHQAAADQARIAAAHFESAGYRLDAARADLVGGEALGRAGKRMEALSLLSDAQLVFESCQATQLRSQARAAMRRLGKRLPTGAAIRSAASDPVGGPLAVLSRREREVAALVAIGHTNRQIAAELVVSEKTVESHLGHIFTKLDVSSRAAVAGLSAGSRPAEH
jgi:DNA-binding NarL/FixJ family response regulator